MTALVDHTTPELADPRLLRLIARLAGPAILGISVHSLQMAANAIFVADLGSTALAAVALVQSMTLAIAALGYGIGIGAASLISRALGRGDEAAAGRAAATALAMMLPAGIIAAVALLGRLDQTLGLFGASPAVVEAARSYAVLSVAGTIVMLVHIVGGFIVRAEANARFSMLVMVGSFGLNIALDALFIPGLHWGLEGAGWAGLLGQLAAAAAYAIYFAKGGSRLGLNLSRRDLVPIGKEIGAIGFPATATALLSALSLVLLLKAAAGSGESAVAALAIALRVVGFGMLPVLGLCTGAEPVFGFAHGAGDGRRLRQSLGIVLTLAAGYGLVWSAMAIAFARPLLAPFAPDAATLLLAIRASNAIESVFVLSALSTVVLVLFQAIGASRRAAALSLAAQGYALLPPLAVLTPLWGFDGVILSRALAEAIACAIAALLLIADRGRR